MNHTWRHLGKKYPAKVFRTSEKVIRHYCQVNNLLARMELVKVTKRKMKEMTAALPVIFFRSFSKHTKLNCSFYNINYKMGRIAQSV